MNTHFSIFLKVFTITFLLFQGGQISAQEEESASAGSDKAFFYFGVTAEPFTIKEDQNLLFITRDQTNDYFSFNGLLKETDRLYGGNFGFEMFGAGYALSLESSLALKKKFFTYNVNIGLGKVIEAGNISIVPKILVGFGSGNIELGHMNNWDLYIEFDDVQFYGDSVEVKLKTQMFHATPQVDFYFPIKKAALRLSVGYRLGLAGKKRIKYTGYKNDDNTEETSVHRPFDHENHNISINDTKVDKKTDIIGFNGLKVQLSYIHNF